MAFLIDRFGPTYASGEILPTAGGTQLQGSSPTPSGLIALPGGGSYDAWGSSRAPAGPLQLTVKGRWTAASASAMEAKLAALKALRGMRDKLWRSNGSVQHWRYARLMEVESAAEGVPTSDLIICHFECPPGPWYGTDRSATHNLDASPKTLTLANNGNARVANAVITLTAAGTAITLVKVAITGVSEFQWSGTLVVGKSLVIDCGAMTVRNDGANAYAGLTLTANHKVGDWLRLEAGNNSVVVARTGGNNSSTVEIAYSDGWA